MFLPFISHEPYIHQEARASYIHFWKREAARLWLWYPEARHTWEPYRYKHYIRPWNVSKSGESSFIQYGISPKILSEKEYNRREWREYKQFNRDRIRGSHWYGSRSRKWACTMQNRWDRHDVKALIKNQEFDLIRTHREPRNKWLWD